MSRITLTRGIGRPVVETVSRYFLRSRARYSNTRYSFFSQCTISSNLHSITSSCTSIRPRAGKKPRFL